MMNIDGGVKWGGGNYALKEQASPVPDIDGKIRLISQTPIFTAQSETPIYKYVSRTPVKTLQ